MGRFALLNSRRGKLASGGSLIVIPLMSVLLKAADGEYQGRISYALFW